MKNKVLKRMSAVLSAAMALMILTCTSTPVLAANNGELNIETGIDKSMEIPLTLDADTEDFYVNGNINPGDVMRATVYFKNTSNSPIQVRIADVIDQKNDTLSAQLMEVLNLTVSMEGSTIYQGNHKNVTSPLTQWIELEGGDILTMNITIEFPKMEADNTFQGAEMHVKYVFEARADVPPDEEVIKKDEIVKTGVEEEAETSNAPIMIGIAGGVILLTVVVIASKKKKDKKTDAEE